MIGVAMRQIGIVLAVAVALLGFGQPAQSEQILSRITRVERPGHGPFVIITLVSTSGVVMTFQDLIKIITQQLQNGEQDYQQIIFRLGIPVVDDYGNERIGPAMEILFYTDREGLMRQDWANMAPADLLKISRASHVTRAGFEWGHRYCGDDPVMAQRIAFCGQFIQ